MTDNTNHKPFTDKFEFLFRLNFLALLISILIIFSGIITIVIGAIKLYEGLHDVVHQLQKDSHPGVHILEAVDTLLFSLVILVLGGGIFKLFVGDENTFKKSLLFSRITTFKDLKILLWETLLLTLTVWCSTSFFIRPNDFSYELLILPVTIVLLAIALKLLKDSKE